MQVVSIISTKGGVGTTTTAANLGGFADAGCACCCWTSTCSPRCRATSRWRRALGGIYELLAFNERRARATGVAPRSSGLDLVLSNDDRGELNTLLLHRSGWAPATAPFCPPSSARTMTCC